jgi:acyl carrier protein
VPVADVILSDVENAVREALTEVLKRSDFTDDDNLLELGVDSLVGTRIVVGLRDRLDVEIPLLTLFENPVIADFAQAVFELKQDQDN